MNRPCKVAACVALVAALAWVGHADLRDAQLQRAHYCRMVQVGAWPDFRHTYRAECKPLGYGAPRKSLYSNER